MDTCLIYDTLDHQRVRCRVCSHECVLDPGQQGICQVRENRDGTLFTDIAGRIIAHTRDPVEKKPLYHLLPGSYSYSIAAAGCNFQCAFCQNADIAQSPRDHSGRIRGEYRSPRWIVDQALATGCRSLSCTYTEPAVFVELALPTLRLAREQGLRTIFVTNGYMTRKTLDRVAPYLDAANVDLKAFTDSFYRRYCKARLAPVLETLTDMKDRGIWVEVTTLVIPGANDSPEELAAIAHFILTHLGPDTPWHLSRFFPRHRMTDRDPTPEATLTGAWQMARQAGLHHVYIGNLSDDRGQETVCPGCDVRVVERNGYAVRSRLGSTGICPECGTRIAGIYN